MCVGPQIGAADSTPPKPAAQQTSDQVASVAPDGWRLLAAQGGTVGLIARAKTRPSDLYPTIVKK